MSHPQLLNFNPAGYASAMVFPDGRVTLHPFRANSPAVDDGIYCNDAGMLTRYTDRDNAYQEFRSVEVPTLFQINRTFVNNQKALKRTSLLQSLMLANFSGQAQGMYGDVGLVGTPEFNAYAELEKDWNGKVSLCYQYVNANTISLVSGLDPGIPVRETAPVDVSNQSYLDMLHQILVHASPYGLIAEAVRALALETGGDEEAAIEQIDLALANLKHDRRLAKARAPFVPSKEAFAEANALQPGMIVMVDSVEKTAGQEGTGC